MDKIWTRVEHITPAMAASYLQRNKVNRPLNKANVEFYARQMRGGKWMLNGEAIMFDTNGDLTNGQTRLNAIIKAGIGVDFLVVRGVDPLSFTTYDQGRNRTYSDIFSISGISNSTAVSAITNRYKMFHDGRTGLYNETSNSGKGGGHHRIRISKQELLDIYHEHADIFQEACRVAYRITKRNIRVLAPAEMGAIYAFLLIDLYYNSEIIESYFEQLCSNQTKWNHINILYKKLVNSMTTNIKLSAQLKTNLLAKSWNLFVTGNDCGRLSWNPNEGKIQFIANPNYNG